MADANIAVTPGVGANVDTRTSPDGDHRQVLVIGDPALSNVANVGVSGALSVRGGVIPGIFGSIAAGATGTVGPLMLDEAGNATIYVKNQVPGTAWAGSPVLVFEQSDDNVSWAALVVVRQDTGQVGSTFTLGAGAANASICFSAGAMGATYARVRVTTGPSTAGITIVIQGGGLAVAPAVGVQQASRLQAVFYTAAPVLTTAAEALLSLTSTRSSATVAATTTPAVVPPGKMLRLQNLECSYTATATAGYALLRVRINQGGAASLTSPLYRQTVIGATTPATAGSSNQQSIGFGDGIDIWPGGSVVVTAQGYAAATGTATGYVTATLSGFEF